MSNYNPTTGKFGCAVTSTGKTGQFNVLKITVKAKDTNLGANAITVTVGNMSKLDGSTMKLKSPLMQPRAKRTIAPKPKLPQIRYAADAAQVQLSLLLQ